MKQAFLLTVILVLAPFVAFGSGPDQPPAQEGAVKEFGYVRPPDEKPAPAGAVRKKISRPNDQAPSTTLKAPLLAAYGGQVPTQWGENVEGIRTQLDTSDPVIALTFDACGGPKGSRYDSALIDYLRKENIPATLFISGSWIDANPAVFKKLSSDPLFEIANHGLHHRPCSVNGKSAQGIKGTKSVSELVDEIAKNGAKIESATGRKPRFYRSGTAYCDEVAVKIARELGYEVVNFNILGDAGATRKKEKIREALLKADAGAIVILHMNQPRSQTAAGVKETIPLLREKGFRFVKLSEYPLK
jgi:peptidoglycan/xylan/chitin deacetylase (PgdA/CDA1 family)